MKIVLVIAIVLLTTSSIVVLKSTIKKSVKFKIKSKARPIDEDFIQEIVNGITNGLVPRIVLAKLCEDYSLTKTKQAALSGDSVIKSLEIDLPKDLLAKGFGSLWQVCENNGAALAGLPLFGIVLAVFLGVNSLQWLSTSSLGNYNIIAALILETTGIIWVTKITSRIENLL
jgi:hypothetical protein